MKCKRDLKSIMRRHWPLLLLGFYLLTALLAPLLANSRGWIAMDQEGQITFPLFQQAPGGHPETDYRWVIGPPVPYLPADQDASEVRKAPFQSGKHLLGTDELGRDVLSMIIHATRKDMSVAFFATLLAGFIGIFAGMIATAGGSGFRQFKRIEIIFILLFSLPSFFYSFMILPRLMKEFLPFPLLQAFLAPAAFIGGILIPARLLGRLFRRGALARKVSLSPDPLINRLIEITVSIPVIYLIIMLVGSLGGQSTLVLILAIGLTGWTGIARLTRAEMLRIREQDYYRAAGALGLKRWQMILRHAVPNALGPVLTALAFGMANAILIESFLSFIGLGFPPDSATWGSLLNAGRQDLSSWWLSLFPGLAIFFIVLALNVSGERWRFRHRKEKI